jgi:uncharacterized protein (TIGR02145 family)
MNKRIKNNKFSMMLILSIFIFGCENDNTNFDHNTENINTIIPVYAGNVIDIDSNVYHTIIVGKQTWMVENLKTTHFRNGDSIPMINNNFLWQSTTSAAYCNYNNNSSFSLTYGRLYNFAAISDSRSICPQGWHVSTYSEWDTLLSFVGNQFANRILRESGTSHWKEVLSYPATNVYGFTALPAGYCDESGIYKEMGYKTFWWAHPNAHMELGNSVWGIFWNSSIQGYGLSVRCVKDHS